MAEVYRARPFNAPNFRRFLAVKRILPNLAADDEFVAMFVDEAKIAVQLNHRAVCQIYELGRLDGSFYIVMEYIAGRDVLALQNWFRKRRKIMSVAMAVHIAIQVCEGLDYAHRKANDDGVPLNIIHRDVSPQNILVSYDGDVKVIDFGIARAATTNQVTQVGVLKGKFGYMSPEQVDAKPLDRRSDVFAVGTLLWEMLTARRLFFADSDYATLEKVRSGTIQPPSERNSRVPAEIDRIVLKALDRNLEDRYQWASEFAADLRTFLSSASPGYGDQKLSAWMVKNFKERLDAEREKISLYSRFVTIQDVHSYYAENPSGDVESDDEDEDEEEATQVFDPNKHGEELLAENEIQPLPTVVEMSEELGTGLPELGSLPHFDSEPSLPSDHMADLQLSSLQPLPPKLRKRSNGPLLAVLILLLAAIGVLGFKVYQSANATGGLTVTTIPPDANVYVDGVELGGASPFLVAELPPGTRVVEIRHPDYLPALAQVDVVANSTTMLDRELEAVSSGHANVELTLGSVGAEVYLDGSLVGGQGAARSFEVGAGEPHTVEVYQPGHFVEVYEFDLASDARFERRVELRAVQGSVTIFSDPAGIVFLDGEEQGSTEGGLSVEGMDIMQTYALEIRPTSRSFLPYEQTLVFDTYYDLRIQPRLPRRGTGRTDEPVTFGHITTSAANRWYRVLVDGRDTGLVTPITAESPLPLKTGARTVTFVRPGDRRDTRVVVAEGEVTNVRIPGE